MSEWVEAILGDLMALDVNAVEVNLARTYDIVGVLNHGRGLLYREPMAGSETAYKTLNRIGPNQVVYSRLKAFEGAITVAPGGLHEVYASQEFPTFTCGPLLLAGYFRLLTTTKRLWARLQNLSTGMGGRRERVKPNDFLTINIALPSLAEQRRIVDVVDTVDAAVDALKTEIERGAYVVMGLQEEWLHERQGMRLARMDEIADIRVGYAYKSSEFSNEPDGIRLLRGDNIAPSRLHWDSAKRLPSEAVADDDPYFLREGDIVVGMDRTWIKAGLRVATIRAQDIPALLVQRVARLRAKPGHDQRLIEFLLNSPSFKQLVLSQQTGTSVPHISGKQIAAFQTWIPESKEGQVSLGQALGACRCHQEALLAELAYLRSFRSNLLTAFLNQEIEIPESYDDLLEKVS